MKEMECYKGPVKQKHWGESWPRHYFGGENKVLDDEPWYRGPLHSKDFEDNYPNGL